MIQGGIYRDPPWRRLLAWFLGRCRHKWEDDQVVKIWAAGRRTEHPIAHKMRQRCRMCGQYRSLDMR